MTDLNYENRQVLDLLQAILGSISQNMRVVSLIPRGKEATLRVLLESDTAVDREEIEDLLTEYFVLRTNGEDEIDSEIVVIGNRELKSSDLKGRTIYIRKCPEEL